MLWIFANALLYTNVNVWEKKFNTNIPKQHTTLSPKLSENNYENNFHFKNGRFFSGNCTLKQLKNVIMD